MPSMNDDEKILVFNVYCSILAFLKMMLTAKFLDLSKGHCKIAFLP